MFADDTTLVISGPNLASLYDKMNEDLVAVSKWCNSNSLKINAQKCDYMIFNKKPHQNQLNISIQGVAISRVNHFKYLGIIIDDRLLWKEHIIHICSKISQGLYGMRRVKHYVSKHILVKLYYAFVHSHLSYGNSIWGNTFNKHLEPLIVLQKRQYESFIMLPTMPTLNHSLPCQIFSQFKKSTICKSHKSCIN